MAFRIEKYRIVVLALGLFALVLLVIAPLQLRPSPQLAAVVTSPYVYSFNSDGALEESARMNESSSSYWWVNSGGRLLMGGGLGSTMLGNAPLLDRWRIAYSLSNPLDTDGGQHPQNLFRLVSRSMWQNVRVSAQFKILKDNWSESPNRNASNGLLLMMRYLDGDTLYYAGLRVDGMAVIKKKYRGSYYTMVQKKEYAGTYAQGGKVNVLPHQEWLSLRGETMNSADGSVTLRLFMQQADGSWKKLLEARDSGQYGGTPPITAKGYLGIRTDFMDVAFDSFRAETI
ncbi:hypothetical protein HY417_03675 [Candidatus Kaiserbacteria bacterium]|nr:hypothetical protein [Candidatus Kaiserbacteria bacterium]